MPSINRRRVVIGGLAGGLTWFLWSTLINASILASFYEEEQVKGMLRAEPRYSFFVGAWVLTLMVLAAVVSWLYAAVRPAWGAGPRTALKLGLLVGFLAGFPGNLAQAAWSPVPRAMPLWWMIDLWVGAVLAALVAGFLYRDEEDATATAPVGS